VSELHLNVLIQAYQSLFPNRISIKNIETMDQLIESIQIELLDELTHPRVRKNPEQKLQMAFERIEKSDLLSSVKLPLIELYKNVYENVNSL